MSDSPQSNPKDVEQGAPSPDEDAQMNDPQDPHSSGLAYEFEVKEQDRWLPIANGMSCLSPFSSTMIRERLLWWCSAVEACACMAEETLFDWPRFMLCLQDSRASHSLASHVSRFAVQVA